MQRGPRKEGVRAVGIDVDLDPRAHEARSHRAFRELQLQGPVGDAIVLADLPLLLNAQDLAEIDARNGGEGGALAGRRNGEAGVVLRQMDVADESVGRLDRRDPGALQCLHQAILKRLEGALRAPARLGRKSADRLDAQLRQRPADLGRTIAVDLAGLGSAEIGEPRSWPGLSRPSPRRRLNDQFDLGLAGGKRFRNEAFPF